MQLSEAIRLGSMLKPQSRHGFFDGVSTCALGAASDAIGRLTDLLDGRFFEAQEWRVLRQNANSPIPNWRSTVWHIVTTLNDVHGWTREQIADWVESVERESASAESGAAVLVEIATQ